MIPWLLYPFIAMLGTAYYFADLPKPPVHPACDPVEHHCT